MEGRVKGIFKEGDIVNGRYAVQKKIGEGGMSKVYLAYDMDMKEMAALKCSSCSMPAVREYHIMKSLDFAGIPRVYGLFIFNGMVVMPLEYIEGATLSGIIAGYKNSVGRYAYRQLLGMIIDVCRIADYLHTKKGILHLDYKPSNIIAGDKGTYLVDYGAAADIGRANKGGDITIYGTREYAAPEQLRRGHMIDVRTDIYQIGAVIDYILKSLGARDRRVRRIAKRCMHGRMSGRYADAREIAALLAGCICHNGRIYEKNVQ